MRHRDAGTLPGPLESRLNAAFDLTSAGAAELDARDPLKALAAEFHHPHDRSGKRLTYLCGHSLGLQHESTKAYVEQELADWRRLAVLGHHAAERPWIPYHERAASGLASLTGAGPAEVVAMNSLTVNLHLMMVSFFRPLGERTRVLIEKSAFPSDRYAVASQLEFHGLNVRDHLIEVEPRPGEQTLRTEDIAERIEREGSRLALVLLPGVQYLSGQLLELAPLVAAARAAGAAVGLDLAHAIGNVPLALHDWNVDFAVWCSYKYLNAGPGAVGGCFVHERHANRRDLPRFAGWWGHDKAARFEMGPHFDPIPGRGRLADQQSSGAVHGPASCLACGVREGGNAPAAREIPGADRLHAPLDRGAFAGRRRYRDASGRGGARKSVEPSDPSSADRGQTLL